MWVFLGIPLLGYVWYVYDPFDQFRKLDEKRERDERKKEKEEEELAEKASDNKNLTIQVQGPPNQFDWSFSATSSYSSQEPTPELRKTTNSTESPSPTENDKPLEERPAGKG